MTTTRCDLCLDAGIVAATLRALGYAARSYRSTGVGGGQPGFGVAIHIVCTEAWRYPDGHWEIVDRPARLVAADPSAPHRWLFNYGVAVPEPTSAAALAAWVAAQLPPPDLPEYRAYWQFTPPSTPPPDAPTHWAQRWCEHWSRGGSDLINRGATSLRHGRASTAAHGSSP